MEDQFYEQFYENYNGEFKDDNPETHEIIEDIIALLDYGGEGCMEGIEGSLQRAFNSNNEKVFIFMIYNDLFLDDIFYYACRGGNLKIVDKVIKKIGKRSGEIDWIKGFLNACEGDNENQEKIIELIIREAEKNNNPLDWNTCFLYACFESKEIVLKKVKLIIREAEKRNNILLDWDKGILHANIGAIGSKVGENIIELIIEKSNDIKLLDKVYPESLKILMKKRFYKPSKEERVKKVSTFLEPLMKIVWHPGRRYLTGDEDNMDFKDVPRTTIHEVLKITELRS